MDNSLQKWVVFSYVGIAILLGFLLQHSAEFAVARFDLETRVRDIDTIVRVGSIVLAALAFLILYKNERVNEFMGEAVAELSRVTWPTQKETTSGMVVVLIMVLISGMILGLLDYVWTALIQKIL